MRIFIIDEDINQYEDDFHRSLLKARLIPISLIWFLFVSIWVVFFRVENSNYQLLIFTFLAGTILAVMLIKEVIEFIRDWIKIDRVLIIDLKFREITLEDKVIPFDELDIDYDITQSFGGVKGFFFGSGQSARVRLLSDRNLEFNIKVQTLIDLSSYLQINHKVSLRSKNLDKVSFAGLALNILEVVIIFLGIFLVVAFRQATIPGANPDGIQGKEVVKYQDQQK